MSSLKINIPFPHNEHNFIVVSGLIFGPKRQRIVKCIVDTGAAVTMIDPDIMESVDYSIHGPEYVSPATVSGPSGKQSGYKVKAQKLLIQSAQCALADIDIVCIRPERNVEALLGLNFLKHFRYCIDHKKQLLTFEYILS